MYKYFFILRKIIYFWNPNHLFKSITNTLSVIVSIISLSFIIIVLSVNDGFKNNIIAKIVHIDGLGRFYKNDYSTMNNDDYNLIVDKLNEIDNDYSISKLISNDCLAKYNGNSEGIYINAIDSFNKKVFNIKEYLVEGEANDSSIIVGLGLANNMGIKINDYIYLIDYNNEKQIKESLSLLKVKVSGIYNINIPSYDEHVVFGTISSLSELFNIKDDKFSSLIISSAYDKNINIKDIYYDNSKYNFESLKERHYKFLNWLFSYDIPIKILLLFIFIISILNVCSGSYIDIINRKKDIYILNALGFSKRFLKLLFIYKNIIICCISSMIAILISWFILFIEKTFSFIAIPKNVYFIDKLPISIDVYNFLSILPFISISILLVTIISLNIILKND